MVFGTCFMRSMLMVEATCSAAGRQLTSRWHTVPYVRLTTGAWRRIFTCDAVNGVLPGPGIRQLAALLRSQSAVKSNEAMLRPGRPGNDGSASAGFARVRARLGTP